MYGEQTEGVSLQDKTRHGERNRTRTDIEFLEKRERLFSVDLSSGSSNLIITRVCFSRFQFLTNLQPQRG